MIAVVVVLSAVAAPARAGMVEDCVQALDWNLTIGGCTAAIRSGQWQGKNLAWAYTNRGLAYDNLGEYRRAIQDFDQALRLDPGDAFAYNGRGSAYRKLGEYRRAIEDFDQAIRLDPGYALAYNIRGLSYESLGEYERAAGDWEQAIRIDGASRAKPWQGYLNSKGHYAEAIDGVYGPDTERGLVACARDPDC